MKTTSIIFASLLLIGAFTLTVNGSPEHENINLEASKAGKGIEFFHGTWKEALAKSKETGKPIFADIYAEWCGPCKTMSNYVFTQEDVGKFYNEKFICVKVDAERGEGPAVARKYTVEGYPTFLFVDGEGSVILKTAGARSGGDFIKLGEKALTKK